MGFIVLFPPPELAHDYPHFIPPRDLLDLFIGGLSLGLDVFVANIAPLWVFRPYDSVQLLRWVFTLQGDFPPSSPTRDLDLQCPSLPP